MRWLKIQKLQKKFIWENGQWFGDCLEVVGGGEWMIYDSVWYVINHEEAAAGDS